MEHIVQFGIGIDDEGIRKRVEASAEQQILRELELDVKRAIYTSSPYTANKFTNTPTRFFDEKISDFLEAHKDDIIEVVAERLADRLSRTKKAKEMLDETITSGTEDKE